LEILTREDLLNLRFFAIKFHSRIARNTYEIIRTTFRDELQLLTTHRLHRRLCLLSGITPRIHDCCVNSCCAYLGEYKDQEQCPWCNEPRFGHDGLARKTYVTYSLEAQLKEWFHYPQSRDLVMYRAGLLKEPDPITIRDVHDGLHAQEVRAQHIYLDGIPLPHIPFSDDRDLHITISTDGFQTFKRAHHGSFSCWPIIGINQNLPPEIRIHIENLIPLGLMPGPSQPKDMDSFLVPLHDDAWRLARGIEAYDCETNSKFKLHAYVLTASADMQAAKHLSGMKGPNALSPCRICKLRGVYYAERRRYYYPLDTPHDKPSPAHRPATYNPRNLPMRSDNDLPEILRKIDLAPTLGEKEQIAKENGIVKRSIFTKFPCGSWTKGYPHEYMHLVFENIVPMLIALWKGDFREVDHSSQGYVIPEATWKVIGQEGVESIKTIHSGFCRALPNIYTHQTLFIAEAYAFWFLHLAPILLKHRFPSPVYYKNAMKLIKIINTCIQYEITWSEVDDLETEIINWVVEFEK